LAGTGTVYNCNDAENDDDYIPTIEEILLTRLQKECYATED
jgi:hypothetical protein